MTGRLDRKVAVVTGGASGIGLATVERFVAEGAAVVFCDLPVTADLGHLGAGARLHHRAREAGGAHDGDAIAARLGDAVRFLGADVTDPAALRAVIDTAVETFGGLDVMVNNAGVGGGEGSIVDCPEDMFDRTVAVDLKAVWLGIKLAAPHLVARGGGAIISTASISGLLGMPTQGAYAAAKGGVIAMTRVAAVELAPHSVRVNCVCPGGIVTPIIHDNPAAGLHVDPGALRELMASAQPIPRAGEPEDIAAAFVYLASDDASFVTGHALVVDGGITAEFDSRHRPRPPRDST